jgi:hypothetical protein
MTLTRITSVLGALALGGVLVASTAGAQAARSPAAPASAVGQHRHAAERTGHFVPPVVHKYGANGMRMGLHCETTDPS